VSANPFGNEHVRLALSENNDLTLNVRARNIQPIAGSVGREADLTSTLSLLGGACFVGIAPELAADSAYKLSGVELKSFQIYFPADATLLSQYWTKIVDAPSVAAYRMEIPNDIDILRIFPNEADPAEWN
jgi:hypothetical protein